jgi:hypothetical protein
MTKMRFAEVFPDNQIVATMSHPGSTNRCRQKQNPSHHDAVPVVVRAVSSP